MNQFDGRLGPPVEATMTVMAAYRGKMHAPFTALSQGGLLGTWHSQGKELLIKHDHHAPAGQA